MRTWRFHKAGAIANLVMDEVAVPRIGQGEVLVALEYAALNPADRYLVQGQYPRAGAPPFTPGRDGAGIIVEAGQGSRFKTGDKVCVLGGGLTGVSLPGTFAGYCPVPEAWLAALPSDWTFKQAAAGALTSLTAWRALVVCGNLQPGETVLVTGASGGVGVAAVFLAKALGAQVIALSRSEEKRQQLIALGADAAIDSESPTLEKEVRAAAGDRPVSLVVEMLGGPYLEKSVRMAAPEGRIMVVGLLADLKATVTIGLLIHKNIRIEGMSVNNFKAEEARAAWTKIVDLYQRNHHCPVISEVFPFEQVQAAFAHLQAGPMGKVVVRCKR
ncbi:MAG: zinc-binding dehydrogenase [Candidatus Hydrogenedentes bacterium]|nr:zinc-binding dehydrogenase [Candidatus Hydrogenedentota bacterium]